MKPTKKRGIYFCLLSFLISFILGGSHIQNEVSSIPAITEDSSQIRNNQLLAWYKNIYTNRDLIPAASFNKGQVSEADLSDYLTKTDNGFIVQLPGSTLVPSPVIEGDEIYISGGFGSKKYYAFNNKTGELVRAWDLDDDGPSSAAIKDSILVFNTESCTIFAIDLRTGRQLWSWWLGDPVMSMPTISNGMVFTAYPGGSVHHITNQESYDTGNQQDIHSGLELTPDLSHILIAFNLKTGDILWQRWIDGDVMSAPVAWGSELYVTTFGGTLYKFQQSSGELISVSEVRATSAPVVTNDGIYVSKRADHTGEDVSEELARFTQENIVQDRNYGKKQAPYLDKNIQDSSELKYQSVQMDAGNGFVSGAPHSSGWYKANENIGQSNVSSLQSYQGSRTLHYMDKNYSTMGNELICSDPSSGKDIWKIKLEGDMFQTGGFMGTPPLEVRGYIVIATYVGEIMVIEAKSGRITEKYIIGDPVRYQPVVQDGWIYITTTNSRLYAINTGKPELTGWPMWGGNPQRTNESE